MIDTPGKGAPLLSLTTPLIFRFSLRSFSFLREEDLKTTTPFTFSSKVRLVVAQHDIHELPQVPFFQVHRHELSVIQKSIAVDKAEAAVLLYLLKYPWTIGLFSTSIVSLSCLLAAIVSECNGKTLHNQQDGNDNTILPPEHTRCSGTLITFLHSLIFNRVC